MEESDFYPSSPVPADKWLFTDEKPFTAFGQYGDGMLDNRVFEQDVWWVNATGEPFVLTEMSHEYLTNILEHLFLNVEYFYACAMLRHAIEMTLTVFLPVEDEFVQHVDRKPSLHIMTPVEWMNMTPIVKRIIFLLDESPTESDITEL